MVSARFRLADLPEHLRTQAERQIGADAPSSEGTALIEQPRIQVEKKSKGARDDHLGRKKSGEMNATEATYFDYLEEQRLAGLILGFKFGCLSLRLAPGCWYRPDFKVRRNDDKIELHEVKGRWRDDALVKIKVASDLYPEFHIRAVFKIPKREGGGWRTQVFG